MARVGQFVEKIRSKNAGPFWLTIDIFCGAPDVYATICAGLATERIAAVFATDAALVKRFEIPALNVVKFSLPRPEVQGAISDRDMHGASWAALIGELEMN